jgi:alkylation response protein AidB-like acyl-CoA dehydrogenase
MFDLHPGDDLGLVVETARRFAEEELRPRIREAESERCVRAEVRRAYAEIGLAGLELPERLGGAGLGAVARVLVNEELAAADAGAALALDPLGPALYPMLELGGEAAVRELAERSSSPGARVVLVTDDDVSLSIEEPGFVSAEVPWVPADRVDAAVLLAGNEALLVQSGLETVALRGAGLRAAGGAELHLVRAPIALRHRDAAGALRARARARLYAASLLLGVLRDACEFSRAYAQERQAFGRPIAHHQALAFLITDMRMALDGARLLVHEAAWRLDAGLPCAGEAAAAFAQCIEAARFIGPNGVQILGGHGFVADYPMEKAMREARALGLWLGGLDAAIETAGREICERDTPIALGSGAP